MVRDSHKTAAELHDEASKSHKAAPIIMEKTIIPLPMLIPPRRMKPRRRPTKVQSRLMPRAKQR